MYQLLSDTNTYRQLHNDPIVKLRNKNNKIVEELYGNCIIDRKTKLSLQSKTCNIAKIYGTIKIHKDGFPIRPIVSTVNTPGAALSKYLANILNNIEDKANYNIKNSFEFKKFIDKVNINKAYISVSYDVKSYSQIYLLI